ncbi:histone deacetylase [Kitasatospora sp. NBC_00240]|uniref:histone deacetylase n=1 Tax=Kitasatospora sp. NBC_00240 TaxID=2903567 RepID=UPI00225185CA|nr:histone deacetylase [Kitasatospora sp. NBC_00240]MCX5212168.1 histone deacetylase [Kitasatospora sp. NBC_00240]
MTPPPPATAASGPAPGRRVWYAAYASNMCLDRFTSYLAGGRPVGAARTYPGCRDARPPERAVPVLLPGQLYFALESAVWTGGCGLYDPLDPGEMPARAYLLSAGQFSDIAAQETARPPGTDLDLTGVLADGRARLGPGRYETLLCAGWLDGLPVLTFTAPWRRTEAEPNRPSAGYLRQLARGLREGHGWSAGRIAAYLGSRPGAAGAWLPADLEGLLGPAGRPAPGAPASGPAAPARPVRKIPGQVP